MTKDDIGRVAAAAELSARRPGGCRLDCEAYRPRLMNTTDSDSV